MAEDKAGETSAKLRCAGTGVGGTDHFTGLPASCQPKANVCPLLADATACSNPKRRFGWSLVDKIYLGPPSPRSTALLPGETRQQRCGKAKFRDDFAMFVNFWGRPTEGKAIGQQLFHAVSKSPSGGKGTAEKR